MGSDQIRFHKLLGEGNKTFPEICDALMPATIRELFDLESLDGGFFMGAPGIFYF